MSSSGPPSTLLSPELDQTSGTRAADESIENISFWYRPLPSHDHFRILELLPDGAIGIVGSQVHCRLRTERLSDSEDNYTAISYVWGDPDNRVPIVCDGKIVEITVNLADALRHIRDHTEHRFVWADAVCINQQDDIEKGHQVKRMGQVYENAVEVVVWLGKDDEGIAEDCFNLIRETNEYVDHQLEIYSDVQNIPLITRESSFSFEKSRWDKVNKLTELPWFRRFWVVQESALAKECQLLWGGHQLDFAELCELSFFIYRMDFASLLGLPQTGIVADNFFAQSTYQPAKSWMGSKPLIKSFLKILQRECIFLDGLELGRRFDVSFDVDRVYAFLGNPLARKHEEHALLIEPDYSKSAEQVYFEVACELLAHPREAPYLLSRVSHHDSDCVDSMALGTDGTLPSWVPRWDKGFRELSMSEVTFWYRAGGGMKFRAIVQNDKSLLLPTINFDHLIWTSDIIQSNNLNLDPNGWDKDTRTSKKPLIDLLFANVQKALQKHWPSGNSELLPNSMSTQDAFSLTIVRQYTSVNPSIFDLVKHQQAFLAYLQAARQLIGILPKKGMRRAAQKLLTSFSRSGKPSQLPHSVQDTRNTSPTTFLRELPCTDKRRFAITKAGRFGLVPWLAEPNDVCRVCPGMEAPLILRPRKDGRYGFVGDSFIHGVMRGEVMEQLGKGEMKLENIVIV